MQQRLTMLFHGQLTSKSHSSTITCHTPVPTASAHMCHCFGLAEVQVLGMCRAGAGRMQLLIYQAAG